MQENSGVEPWIQSLEMSIFAEHMVGFFNLWLLMVLYLSPMLLTLLLRGRIFQATSSRFSSSRGSREYNLFVGSKILMLVCFLYAIGIPIRLQTYTAIIGLIMYVVGFALYSAAWITIAKSEKGKIFSSGLYRFSRHPVYLSSAIQFIGAGFISESWLYLGLSVLVAISDLRNAMEEERICLEIYGDEYGQYMLNTARWLGWPARKSRDHHKST